MSLLEELHGKHGAGKNDLVALYDELLRGRRLSIRKVLEIGIGNPECMGQGYVPGASLRMWEEYCPHADVYAADIDPTTLVNTGRVNSMLCDQGNTQDLFEVSQWVGKHVDLIIDDGSHKPTHQVLTARMLMPMLTPDGIYIIEDLLPEHADWIRTELADFKPETRVISARGIAVVDICLILRRQS